MERKPALARPFRGRLNAAYLQGIKDERERWTHVDEALGPHEVEAHGRQPLGKGLRLATSRYHSGDLGSGEWLAAHRDDSRCCSRPALRACRQRWDASSVRPARTRG